MKFRLEEEIAFSNALALLAQSGQPLDKIYDRLIFSALISNGHNLRNTARGLGIGYSTAYRALRRLGLSARALKKGES